MKFIWNYLNKSVLEFLSSKEFKTSFQKVKGYKEWVGLLTQTGTDDPEVIVFNNELGVSITWTRDDSGEYYATLPSFTNAGVIVSDLSDSVTFAGEIVALDNEVWIYSYDGGSLDDGLLNNTLVKILVKNG